MWLGAETARLRMDWELTYLAIHIAALVGAALLFWRDTPDAIQKLIMGVLIAAMAVYIGADIWALAGEKRVWPIRLVASKIEHAAVLVWIFRLIWVRTGTCQYLKSSR